MKFLKTKNIAHILSIILIMVSCLSPVSVFAEDEDSASASFYVKAASITVGDQFSVSLTFTSAIKNIDSISGSISYDNSLIEFVSGDYISGAGGALIINAGDGSISPSTSCTFNMTFKALSSGIADIKLDSSNVTSQTDVIGSPMTAAQLTVKDPVIIKSSNANLKTLSISYGTLKPAFSPAVTAYTVSVANNVTTFPISATQEDPKAVISSISGSSDLIVGNNTRSVVVTAEDGTRKTYNITITRAAATVTTTKPPATTKPPTPTPDNTTPRKTSTPTDSPTASSPNTASPSASPTESAAAVVSPSPSSTGSSADIMGELKSKIAKFLIIAAIIIILVVFTSVYLVILKDKKSNGNASSVSKKSGNRKKSGAKSTAYKSGRPGNSANSSNRKK